MARSASSLINESRVMCERVAEGPFTPLAFERQTWITGERGWLVMHASVTVDGRGCNVFTGGIIGKQIRQD